MTENRLETDPIFQNAEEIFNRVQHAAAQSGRSPKDIQVVAVTKTVPWERVNRAVDAGFSVLGENRVQEFLEKRPHYPLDRCSVHFIGTLQTNKVKYIIDKVDMIQSVGSLRLAQEIDRQAKKHGKTMDILLEVNIGREESKSGILPAYFEQTLWDIAALKNTHIRGLMAIPPQTSSEEQNNDYFLQMHQLFIDIQAKKMDNVNMDFLSMGMSQDFESAICCGANMVRIGTSLFGSRK